MENMLNKIANLEEKIFKSINLLEIAKTYCESNFDKGSQISAVGTLIEVVLNEQKKLADELEKFTL